MRNGEGCFDPANTRRKRGTPLALTENQTGPLWSSSRTRQEAPDLQTQIADESNTQALLQLSSEVSTHQPHRCSTRDQRHITENSPIKAEALGLVKRF
jgi:hypothetical protein